MAFKPNFTHKKKRQRHGQAFWDSEYKNPEHLALSMNPSEDLEKFLRWLGRFNEPSAIATGTTAVDFGCGNGRHLIHLANKFGLSGVGYDQSRSAITQARTASASLPISYEARSIAGTFPLPDASAVLALDMMTSHYLTVDERTVLRDEIFRILMPGGFLFMKTFLLDGDLHSVRLMKDHPGTAPNSYIHPVIGVEEYVYDEETLTKFLSEKFILHKIYRSHKHSLHGTARRRRTITIYAQKDPYL